MGDNGMDPSHVSEHEAFTAALEARSLVALLEEGIRCIHQGQYVEGMSCFTLASEQLFPTQLHLAAAIDALKHSHTDYWQSQQAVLLACKRLVETEAKQQACLLVLEQLLPALREKEGMNEISQPHAAAPSSVSTQSQLALRSSRSFTARSDDVQSPPAPPILQSHLAYKNREVLPALYITCFGCFRIRRFDQVIALCHNRSGQAILRYLVAQSGYPPSIDTMIDMLWPKDAPEVARRKLQIAISAVRRSLNDGYECESGQGYLMYKDQFYQINPVVTIQTDVDKFVFLWQAGRQASPTEAVALYERACNLYTGPFLVEDIYADWSFIRREQLSQMYLSMCRALVNHHLEIAHYEDVVKWADTILKENCCDEAAQRQLMRAYAAEGRRSEAVRQYQRCERVLLEELGVPPMPETTNLLEAILTGNDAPQWKSENRAKIERK